MSESYGAVLAMINIRYSREDDRTEWSWNENKTFENVIAATASTADNNFSTIVGEISSGFPGKKKLQIQKHFDALIEDIRMIECGLITLPDYSGSANKIRQNTDNKRKATAANVVNRQFLTGLDKYGKGDWRSISRHCVMTKTPIQIASHAQKYFLSIQQAASTRTTLQGP